MAKDNANEEVVGSAASGDAGESPEGGENRRDFFGIASMLLGAAVSIGPALFGLFSFLDPWLRKPVKPVAHRDRDSSGPAGYVRVASMASLLVNSPQRFPVIDDQRDAWNFTPDQPVGAVYIEKLDGKTVRVFNATCPHAGCSVSCTGQAYECPCHNSAFNLDGTKRVSESGRENPSPRDLDDLKYAIQGDEVWVEFKNFYTGKHDKKPKA